MKKLTPAQKNALQQIATSKRNGYVAKAALVTMVERGLIEPKHGKFFASANAYRLAPAGRKIVNS